MRRWVGAAAVAVLALTACSDDDGGGTAGSSADSAGTVVTPLTVEDFSRVVVAGSLDADITVGPAVSVEVHGDPAEVGQVSAQVVDGNLFLRTPDDFERTGPLDVVLTTPALEQVSIGGTGNVSVTGVAADRFVAEIGGTGNLTATGTAKSLTAALGGSGDLGLDGLPADEVDVQLIGKGNVGVYANQYLSINIIGNGNVVYRGDATVEQVITGDGTVQKAD